MIKYEIPRDWIKYDIQALVGALTEAKAAMLALSGIPHQKSWLEELQILQLKREVAGTSRIEGAEFTEREFEAALKETADQLQTRSQRQAHAAMATYRWLAEVPKDRPVTCEFIREIHRRMVKGADDDHCPPGEIRKRDQNVNFGVPRHRGAEGGDECAQAFAGLCGAIAREFQNHDYLLQSLAAHYHFAAMHPFLDGNGRTARALEAFMLQKGGLRDTVFIAMSNYYYDEKNNYLAALTAVRASGYDLTPFLSFGLKGIRIQCERVREEITVHIKRSIFRNLMYDLFNRLQSTRKRVVAERQLHILRLLLQQDEMPLSKLTLECSRFYDSVKSGKKLFVADLVKLLELGAVKVRKEDGRLKLSANLEWPAEITENGFMEKVNLLPKAKSLAAFTAD